MVRWKEDDENDSLGSAERLGKVYCNLKIYAVMASHFGFSFGMG